VTLTVVATANHYVFDALAGVTVTAAGFAIWQLNARSRRVLAFVARLFRPAPHAGGRTTCTRPQAFRPRSMTPPLH
jgi:hypothetical protein